MISVNYSFNVIQIADSCCEYITGGVKIYLYECVTLFAPECVVCICVCLISNHYHQKTHYVSDLSKPDTLMHGKQHCPSGTKVWRLNMCRSIISLSKIRHHMRHNHSFSQQKNKNNTSCTIALLTVFIQVFCHIRVENLLKGPVHSTFLDYNLKFWHCHVVVTRTIVQLHISLIQIL